MDSFLDEISAAFPQFQLNLEPSPDSTPLTTMDEFARFVLSEFESGRGEHLRPAFEIVEKHLASEDEEISAAMAFGFLETLQNVASHRTYGADVFRSYLGETALYVWNDLNTAWEGKSSLADVLAAEAGASLDPPWWQFWKRRRRPSPKEMLDQVENPELRKIIEGMTRQQSPPKD